MPKDVIWVIIANPENRRVDYFSKALKKHELTSPIVISYETLLGNDSLFKTLIQSLKPFLTQSITQIYVKIDSPGENFIVEKALIKRACSTTQRLNVRQAEQLSFDKGRFLYVKEWFTGYRLFLKQLDKALCDVSTHNACQLNYLNTPQSIIQMSDKYQCQKTLQQHTIRIPLLLTEFAPSAMPNFNELITKLRSKRKYQVFIKSRYGSSAAGIMALRLKAKIKRDEQQLIARTTITMNASEQHNECQPIKAKQKSKQLQTKPPIFYNSLKIKTYQKKEDIALLYHAIMAEDAYVEEWIPKPQINAYYFDLRVVVIMSKATHYVTRCSRSPMSNLHLGNHRGDIFQHPQGQKMLKSAFKSAEEVAKVFPDAHCFGVDILCSRTGKTRVLEVNAFGDLLPDILQMGLNTYEKQVIEFKNKHNTSRALI